MKSLREDSRPWWRILAARRRLYASYAPKRHAFAVARREADKRGFTKRSGKTIQIVTDGDEDFETYVRELSTTR